MTGPHFASLRKGRSSVYLQYEHGGDTIGADQFAVRLENTTAVLSFRLSPVDSNQKSDEERLYSERLKEIHIDDIYIIEKLGKFLNWDLVQYDSVAVEISSRERQLELPIEFDKHEYGLRLIVLPH